MKNGYFIGNIPNIFRQTHMVMSEGSMHGGWSCWNLLNMMVYHALQPFFNHRNFLVFELCLEVVAVINNSYGCWWKVSLAIAIQWCEWFQTQRDWELFFWGLVARHPLETETINLVRSGSCERSDSWIGCWVRIAWLPGMQIISHIEHEDFSIKNS